MTEDKVKSSGGPSKTEKARLSAQDKSTGSELSLMEQHLLKSERHEQIAIGEEWDKSATKKELEDWDKTWQAASKRKD
ncbi:hypothetical protein F4776DRAFT_663126 [Hypoxylon sp. NC0597]|nr:hypothetical protein F4776DRAFT_663126 [Hypoxylon sp. NC0597]